MAKLFLHATFALIPVTVFVIDNHLTNGVVSGKYFWFYGNMGLVSIAALIYSILNKQSFRFLLTDSFVCLFVGSVFLSAFVFNDASANQTKRFKGIRKIGGVYMQLVIGTSVK